MNKKEKNFFIFAILLFVLIIIYYFTYGQDLNTNINLIKDNLKKTERKKAKLEKILQKTEKELNKWEKTNTDIKSLKKEFCYLRKESNVLRFSIEKSLIETGFNPANEKTSITKITKGFWVLNFKFNTIPEDNMFLLIKKIREEKSLVFIDSLTISNFPQISASIIIKGVLTDEK
jgi:hypothetical protein